MFDLYRLLLPLDNSLSIQSSRFMSWVLAVFQGCFCTYVYARTSPIQVHSTLKTYCPASSILYHCYWLSLSDGIAIFAVLTLYYCCFGSTHFLPFGWLTNVLSTAQFLSKIAFLVMNGSILNSQTHTLSYETVAAELTTMTWCWYFRNSATLLPLYGWLCPSASLMCKPDCIFTIYPQHTNHLPLLTSMRLLVAEIDIPRFWFCTHFWCFCRYESTAYHLTATKCLYLVRWCRITDAINPFDN